jgi:DNA-binding response OmpR family regulator
MVLLIHNGMDVSQHISYLTSRGLTVFESHGEEAVSSALSRIPDIIVLDYDCDGEVLAQLKSNDRTSHIPVIGLKDLPDSR